MRFEGTVTNWNDERGFGTLESSQGGEPIFMHVSAWPRGAGRPQLKQAVSFEVEVGPKGKRARDVRLQPLRRVAPPPKRASGSAAWGTATLFAIPTFLVLCALLSMFWKLPVWVGGLYGVMSLATYLAYAADKQAAARSDRRMPESTLHALALAGGWPGALLAQQRLRHKSAKVAFRRVFWATVMLNVAGLVLLALPLQPTLFR